MVEGTGLHRIFLRKDLAWLTTLKPPIDSKSLFQPLG